MHRLIQHYYKTSADPNGIIQCNFISQVVHVEAHLGEFNDRKHGLPGKVRHEWSVSLNREGDKRSLHDGAVSHRFSLFLFSQKDYFPVSHPFESY